jgi:hypothetical protein
MQEGIKELEAEMSRIKAMLDEQTKEVEEAKRAASKAAKAFEQAQKEISLRVGRFTPCLILRRSDDIYETRTTKSRGWGLNAQAFTVNAASKRLSCLWPQGISRMFPWRRFVFPLSQQSQL